MGGLEVLISTFFFSLCIVSYKMWGKEGGGGEGSVTKTSTHTIYVWPVIQADVP